MVSNFAVNAFSELSAPLFAGLFNSTLIYTGIQLGVRKISKKDDEVWEKLARLIVARKVRWLRS